ncbi:MAG: MOSC domain-containing protein, partial [Saprospiraceae bacterium]|nr:MOSC domain-containing protein [Saprospiraceae bacterium]
MLKISQLFTYPVKSLAGISLNSSNVTEKGLEYDRRWMLVNAD